MRSVSLSWKLNRLKSRSIAHCLLFDAQALARKMILRSFRYVWLAVFLVFAQQEAYSHALTHLEVPAQDARHSGKGLPQSHACDKCVVFASIDFAAVSSPPTLEFDRGAIESLSARAAVFHSEFSTHYRSRAPPALA